MKYFVLFSLITLQLVTPSPFFWKPNRNREQPLEASSSSWFKFNLKSLGIDLTQNSKEVAENCYSHSLDSFDCFTKNLADLGKDDL